MFIDLDAAYNRLDTCVHKQTLINRIAALNFLLPPFISVHSQSLFDWSLAIVGSHGATVVV